MFALVDCNSFYVSCERIFRPDLHHKPVVVLSNNDGCVISRSHEAKKLNIPMGAVAHEYAHIFKKNNVSVFSANFTLYGDISKRVMNTLQQCTHTMEVYSIDEAFLDLSHIPEDELEAYGQMIHKKIRKHIGIPTCIGIGKTKTLAKTANHIAKKYKQCENVYVIHDDMRERVLKKTAIESIWGIGKNFAKMLHGLNIYSAYDFTELNSGAVQKENGCGR